MHGTATIKSAGALMPRLAKSRASTKYDTSMAIPTQSPKVASVIGPKWRKGINALLADGNCAVEQFEKDQSADERDADAQQRANQKIFGEPHVLELRVARNGLCREDQPRGRRGMQQ